MKIRTRYAPSPTGFFHIGGARTALFNYLFAKHNGGIFVVRNEDTDVERNVEGGIESQLNNIDWLGFSPDESPIIGGNFAPYQQTKKLDRYLKLAETLLEQKKAYRCFCTKEDLDNQRKNAELNHETPKYNRNCLHLSKHQIQEKLLRNEPYTIRLKIEDGDYSWDDLIRGPISIPSSAMTDPVIIKSNKIPMYNFAVVVDDYDMNITHILRGEEHISNTPYQIAIKSALGFIDKDIRYGHLSIIVNDEGKKLSKRDVNLKQFIDDYKNLGYLPLAIINFLCLLGWTPKNNKEILTLNEMIELFDISMISKAPAKFDVSKMNWISNQHFKLLKDNEYLEFVNKFVKSKNKDFLDNKNDVLLLFKNQISYARELDNLIEELFLEIKELDDTSKIEFNSLKDTILLISEFVYKSINNLNEFNVENIKNIINDVKSKFNLNGKNLFMSIRLITTLKSHGPELAKTIFLLGKNNVLNNIKKIKGM